MKPPTQLPSSHFSSLLLTTTNTILFLFLFLFLLVQPIPALASRNATSTKKTLNLNYIKARCNSTLYPELCYGSLSRYASAVQQDPARLARASIALSLSRARRLSSYLSTQDHSSADHVSSSALRDCSSTIGDAVDEMQGSLKQMRVVGSSTTSAEQFRFQMSNVQTWMSSALTNEETCTDGFEEVDDGPLKTEVCDRVVDVKKYTSNALALVNTYANSISD